MRYCVDDLGRPMLWCTSGIAEFRSLTIDEGKRLLEVGIDVARAANPVSSAGSSAVGPSDVS